MLRFLNIFSVVALIGSAVYAYTIKYATSYRSEQIAKTKLEIKAERDAIAVLRAEWSFLTRPERLQQLSDKYLDLKPLTVAQIVSANALPDKSARVDQIGGKLGELGSSLPSTPITQAAPTATPKAPAQKTAATTSKAAAATSKGAARKP